MAVLGNPENSSVPPAEMQQNLELDDEYNKYTPSADYNSTSNKHIFRNKKFTKKRHESKTRRTDQDASNACCSDEDYPQKASSSKHPDVHVSHNIPKMMMSINQTIKKMSLKDGNSFCYAATAAASTSGGAGCGDPGPVMGVGVTPNNQTNLNQGAIGVGEIGGVTKEPVAKLELDVQKSPQCNNSSSCNMQAQAQPQGKRRRHRRKQQYKRMAVDVMNDKKCIQLKVPTSNSSEDSGIGKRKRNVNIIISEMLDLSSKSTSVGSVSVPVPVSNFDGQSAPQWQLDDLDAVMMDCDDLESSSITKVAANLSGQAVLVTEEESGESDTQNGDIESLSDQNQDADDEESDYYNNDSSTTSLSESSFTILNPSKKFIPVHSREIRSGRRRLKTTTSIDNEELTKFLQSSKDTTFKWTLSSEKERQDVKNLASMYSLSYEEGCDQEQRVWIQLTKTSKTTSQRRNDMIKAGDRSTFNTFMEGSSLGPLFDTCVTETGEGGENSDGCINMADSGGRDNVGKGGLAVNQVVNSKRIKKGC